MAIGRRGGSSEAVCLGVEEFYALDNVRNGIVPVVLVFNGEMALETLILEDPEHCRDVQDAGSPDYVMGTAFGIFRSYIFEMQGDDPAVKLPEAVQVIESAPLPMSHIGA